MNFSYAILDTSQKYGVKNKMPLQYVMGLAPKYRKLTSHTIFQRNLDFVSLF